jgi:hypothetical protein
MAWFHFPMKPFRPTLQCVRGKIIKSVDEKFISNMCEISSILDLPQWVRNFGEKNLSISLPTLAPSRSFQFHISICVWFILSFTTFFFYLNENNWISHTRTRLNEWAIFELNCKLNSILLCTITHTHTHTHTHTLIRTEIFMILMTLRVE